MKQYIINVVSGKGGTGKTLLACVLADMLGNAPDTKVAVIDLDFFVRGLTSLLYFHHQEKLQIVPNGKFTISDFFLKRHNKSQNEEIAVVNYRSFDVVPAVSRIDERINFHDVIPVCDDGAEKVLQDILERLSPDYRFIILDSRAGYDEIIAAAHKLSDVSICVEEEDPISRITADNLVSQLGQDSNTPVFRLVNKARGYSSSKLIESDGRRGITDLGVIPFDMDILNSFGSKDFWDQVSRSLYKWALVRAWNRLSSKLQFDMELHSPRLSPLAYETIEAQMGFLSLRDRILFAYGFLLAIGGISYGLWGKAVFDILGNDPFRALSLVFGFAGLGLALHTILFRERRRNRLAWHDHDVDRKDEFKNPLAR